MAAHVEVDTATGFVKVLHFWAVEDCGRVINPLLVDEQIRGGVVQGIGGALYEECHYSPDGQFLNATMADYMVPMAIEFGPHGIRVNTLCPTFVRTALTAPTFSNPEKLAWIEDKIKLGRVGEVEDLMGAVVYLASEASAMVTGIGHLVDGGWTAD